MGFYDAFKDALNLAQKADNIELYRQLLDLGKQALDMQEEISRLKEENRMLRRSQDLEDRIIRHQSAYISLQNDTVATRYCSHCWDNEHKLIQLNPEPYANFKCPHCKNLGIYDDAASYTTVFS